MTNADECERHCESLHRHRAALPLPIGLRAPAVAGRRASETPVASVVLLTRPAVSSKS
jgi:hypothetical protein